MSFLYAVAFGGFVAFSTYLPTFLKDVYSFDLTAAGTRTAGFAIAAVVARPIGGVLSDRIGPRAVVAISLAGTTVLAIILAFRPPLERRPASRSSPSPSSSASAPAASSPGSPASRRRSGSAA